jgi:hypothetical protein
MKKIYLILIVIGILLILFSVIYFVKNKEGENSCKIDSDCACGRHITTEECFVGNKQYVITENPCPDFCTGIAGNLETKCIDNKCNIVSGR